MYLVTPSPLLSLALHNPLYIYIINVALVCVKAKLPLACAITPHYAN